MTSNLEQRLYQHRQGLIEGFTKRHAVNQLVYLEECPDVSIATNRERQLKEWNRDWKIDLIEEANPEWLDLSKEMFDWIPNQVRDDGFMKVST